MVRLKTGGWRLRQFSVSGRLLRLDTYTIRNGGNWLEPRIKTLSIGLHILVRHARIPVRSLDDRVIGWKELERYDVSHLRLDTVGLERVSVSGGPLPLGCPSYLELVVDFCDRNQMDCVISFFYARRPTICRAIIRVVTSVIVLSVRITGYQRKGDEEAGFHDCCS